MDLIGIICIDHIEDIIALIGGITDLGIIDGGIPHGGRDIIIVPGIILLCILEAEYCSLLSLL